MEARFAREAKQAQFALLKPYLVDSQGLLRYAQVAQQLGKSEDAVSLNVGTRTITFPGFFGEALDFALTNPGYAIRELPGGLEDELKLVFIERLMQEALIVRK